MTELKLNRRKAARALLQDYNELYLENSEQKMTIKNLQSELEKRDQTIRELKAKLKVERLCQSSFVPHTRSVPDIGIVVSEIPKNKVKTMWDKQPSIFTPYTWVKE